jgi:hypothetical protein
MLVREREEIQAMSRTVNRQIAVGSAAPNNGLQPTLPVATLRGCF